MGNRSARFAPRGFPVSLNKIDALEANDVKVWEIGNEQDAPRLVDQYSRRIASRYHELTEDRIAVREGRREDISPIRHRSGSPCPDRSLFGCVLLAAIGISYKFGSLRPLFAQRLGLVIGDLPVWLKAVCSWMTAPRPIVRRGVHAHCSGG